MKRVLLTGFEPFGGESVNPSWEALELLNPDRGVVLEKLHLPVSFKRAPKMAIEAIETLTPDAVICVGQAGGRACINIERIAVNLAMAKNPDADGYRPVGERVIASALDARFSTADVDEIVKVVRSRGIPCHPSNSAGLYVCNSLLFSLLDRFPNLPILFIHLPYSLEQAIGKGKDTPSMALPTMASAIDAVIGYFADK